MAGPEVKAAEEAFSGAGGAQQRHRTYHWTYTPQPDVLTPYGNRNTGYVTGTLPNYQPFARADIPGMMGDDFGFGLPRPRFMREPGSHLGTFPIKG